MKNYIALITCDANGNYPDLSFVQLDDIHAIHSDSYSKVYFEEKEKRSFYYMAGALLLKQRLEMIDILQSNQEQDEQLLQVLFNPLKNISLANDYVDVFFSKKEISAFNAIYEDSKESIDKFQSIIEKSRLNKTIQASKESNHKLNKL